MNKKITILILILAVIAIVSGCLNKPSEPVDDDVNIIDVDSQADLINNQSDIENNEPAKEYEITQNENGWKTFKSYKCGFEISFPSEFDWSGHCEDNYHPKFPQLAYLSISNLKQDKNNPFAKNGDLSITIIDTGKRENEIIFDFREKIESYDGKNGSTTITIERLNFLGETIKLRNTEAKGPIEGPPFLKKIFYYKNKDKNLMVISKVYYNNKEMNDLFYEIVKTIKFTWQKN